MNEASKAITDLHYKIIDSYYEGLRGRYSSNSYIWSLKNHLAEVESFLNYNQIVYNRFSEFQIICDRSFEAMFASYAINESSGSRLESFDSWTFELMMLYGDSVKLNKFCLRYNLSKIKYLDSDGEAGAFYELLDNFFSNYLDLNEDVPPAL